MLLICHSLGGIILKQAFCIANEQLHRYEYLVNQVAGIIFISTPHLGSGRASILETALLMLRATTRTSLKLSPQKVEEEESILLDLSVRFETIHLRAPILSIYETKETRVPDGRFRHKTAIVSHLLSSRTYVPRLISRSSLIARLARLRLLLSNSWPFPQTTLASAPPKNGKLPRKRVKCPNSSLWYCRKLMKQSHHDSKQVSVNPQYAGPMAYYIFIVDFRYTTNTSYSPTNSARSSISFERLKQGKNTMPGNCT